MEEMRKHQTLHESVFPHNMTVILLVLLVNGATELL